jgi:hypothetical protein
MIITTTIYPDGRQERKTEYSTEEFLLLQRKNIDIEVKTFELLRNSARVCSN